MAPKRTPVAPINGFNKIGGTTNSASLKTSTLLGANVVVELVVVASSTRAEVESSPPPHIETIIEKIVKLIINFFLTPSSMLGRTSGKVFITPNYLSIIVRISKIVK